jgi:hypothetical protein
MGRDNITRTGARAPGVERQQSLAWWCLATQEADGAERRQNRCEWRARRMEANRGLVPGMPGAGLTGRNFGKALSETPALEPYWGKPAVRNLREDNGNVGIIRSPVRAIVLPDLSSPPMKPVLGIPVNNPWPAATAPCLCGNETQGAAAVPRREGNEVTREGRQEVGVLHSTWEAGEPTRGTPWREGGTGKRARSRGIWRRDWAPQPYQRNSSG